MNIQNLSRTIVSALFGVVDLISLRVFALCQLAGGCGFGGVFCVTVCNYSPDTKVS